MRRQEFNRELKHIDDSGLNVIRITELFKTYLGCEQFESNKEILTQLIKRKVKNKVHLSEYIRLAESYKFYDKVKEFTVNELYDLVDWLRRTDFNVEGHSSEDCVCEWLKTEN